MTEEDVEFRKKIRSDVPHSARVWNAWLGGKDNYPVDRELADAVTAAYPQTAAVALASRAFQARAVRHLATLGVRQFLDVGTGLPVENSTHEVAQAVAPDARIVYVDNDPIVLVHAAALLTSTPEGRTAYVDADLSRTDAVVDEASETLDLSQPVAVLLLSTLGHLTPSDGIQVVQRYMARMPSGSYLVLCDTVKTPETLAAQEAYDSGDNPPYLVREPEEITGCAEGLELLDPGFVSIPFWRPTEERPTPVDQWGLVARKP
ncbi:SAM-dependent methyltransferase [Streptomyces halstedii]|uniref:SAM-dependent methyltransferase n=1 Tax=Streptomyces halstedii TaxID=1944 RepID=A0A6N9U1N2_STRHA|nr:SAM-dependent methyltransferase [Streptomyces halstedii]MBV7673452.1 SAM-dependent methyltransferase [Streptomyces halstedii]NEA17577.1 SAM-dependent methyltransferase [Streptomyces halstedii]